jgi:hypothetical protein
MRRTIFINENPASGKALARIDHVATVTGWTRARATCWLIESAPSVTLYDPFGKPYPEQGVIPPTSNAPVKRSHKAKAVVSK